MAAPRHHRGGRAVLAAVLCAVLTPLAPLATLTPLAPAPAAAAREPDIACARTQTSAQGPVPSAQQAAYRARLHSFATGRGVRVAVIDTGVSPHPQLAHLSPGADFVTAEEPDPLRDCDVHGTVVAGVIAGRESGVAPDAEIYSIRQTSAHYRYRSEEEDSGAGTLATLAAAIDDAVHNHAKVINISVVSCVPPAAASRVDTAGLDAALRRAEEAGAVIVAATGNAAAGGCAKEDVVFPANAETVLAVGALATPHDLAEYSIPAAHTGLAAEGHVPLALDPAGGWATGKFAPNSSSGAQGASASAEPLAFHGTSFAAPVVSGTVALLAQRYPEDSPAQLRARILGSAEPSHGVVDPLNALTFVPSNSPVPTNELEVLPSAQHSSPAVARLGSLALVLAASLVVAALRAGQRRAG
ncbi:S8 family serine peptidase [Corynebacterium sp.]|uniref:S8 family serine peptidase n=1 Tax=Corynebacterium sp. TaxID=1720 RepID=UPI0026DB1B50|nr:S8 family serine peptidase [Corynebacterium sp.]MDO5031276.1 S8 family serine peptidase [Corynebacterium sp.]